MALFSSGERRITKRRRGRQRRRPRREGNGRTVFASDALAVIPTGRREENSKGGGQSRLFKAHAFIAGAGGLGCPSVLYLAGAGVGKICLRRRIWKRATCTDRYATETKTVVPKEGTKTNKAISAIRAAKSLNPTCSSSDRRKCERTERDMELLRDADVVLDCTDNQRARYVLSDACAKLRTPLVSGASVGVEGQLVVYNEREEEAGGRIAT